MRGESILQKIPASLPAWCGRSCGTSAFQRRSIGVRLNVREETRTAQRALRPGRSAGNRCAHANAGSSLTRGRETALAGLATRHSGSMLGHRAQVSELPALDDIGFPNTSRFVPASRNDMYDTNVTVLVRESSQSLDAGGSSRPTSPAFSARTTFSNSASNLSLSFFQPRKSAASRDRTAFDFPLFQPSNK